MKGIGGAMTLLLSFLVLCRYALAVNVLHMTMSRSNPGANVLSRDLNGNVLTRATVTSDLFNNMTGESGYLVNVNVGTPGQTVSLIIDTGSSDTFVLAQIDDRCNDPGLIDNYGPCIGGTFDPSASSTFTTVAAGGFKIEYLDNSQSRGDYISDNFEIGGSMVSALQMGLALHSTVYVGIMGIGYQAGESVSAKNIYPNLVDQLVAQKFINLKAYSLYLDDKETSTGSILFGGIDTEKFIGTLKALPIQENPRTNTISSFTVLMTSLSITDKSETSTWTSSNMSLPVVLDSGTTLTYLPTNLVNTIMSQLGAFDDTSYSGLIFVDCDWRTTRVNDSLSFGFGGSDGPVIHVPLSEVIRTIEGYYPDSPFQNTCDLGIRAADLSTYLLGDTFLRSAYVVYDLDHNQIALAQTNFEAPGSQVHEIPSGASGIPSLSGQARGLTQVPESHFTTTETPSSAGTPTPLDTTVAAGATSVAVSGSMPTNGGGSTAMPTSTATALSTSTQTSTFTEVALPTGSSAAPKSAAARTLPALQKGAFAILCVAILIALAR